MVESMYEISLTCGLGPIKFGVPPSEVKAKWGSELHYEEWMGGNLENFLYFKGLLVGFRGEIDEQPNENSVVCMFQVKTVHPLMIWDKEISNASQGLIEDILIENNIKYKVLSSGIVQCIGYDLQFQFKCDNKLDMVYFSNLNS